jgi:hypothetical protein
MTEGIDWAVIDFLLLLVMRSVCECTPISLSKEKETYYDEETFNSSRELFYYPRLQAHKSQFRDHGV